MKFFRLLVVLVGWVPFTVSAQKITVVDSSGKPLSGAVVYLIQPNGKSAVFITDQQGNTTSKSEMVDTVQVLVRHLGYFDYSSTIVQQNHLVVTLRQKPMGLSEVVVTGEIAPKDLNAVVQPVTLIPAEKIENLSASTLEEVMATQLNVRINQDAALGSSMSINGMTGQNIKFLVDGVPVTGRLDGNIDPSQLNMNNVERIEMVEGPMSAAYGTDAAGGVINIITKKPGQNKYEAGANLLYGTNGQYNADGYGGFALKKSAVLVTAGRNYFDGWSVQDTSRAQEWKPKEQLFGDVTYKLNLKNLILGYRGSVFHETITDKGAPRFTPYSVYGFDTYYKTTRFTNQITSSYLIKPEKSWTTSLSRSDYRRTKSTYRKDLVALQEQLVAGDDLQDTTTFITYNLRSTYNKFKVGDEWNVEAGIDLNHESADGSRFTESKENIGDYAFFGGAEYTASEKVVIKPALRMTYNTNFKAPAIPSVSVKYTPVKQLALRASYGKGFRAPGVKELYLYFVDVNHNVQGNENLTPEYSDNFFFSAGYDYRTGKTQQLVKLSAFYSSIRDMITLAQPEATSSLYTYVNIGNYATHGGSLENTTYWKSLSATVGFALTGRYNLYADSGAFSKYLYSPDAFFSLENKFQKINLWAGVYVKYNGELPGYRVEADNSITQFTNDSYTFVDASVRKSLVKDLLSVTVGVKNLLDITSINGTGQGGAHTGNDDALQVSTGRSMFFKLQLRWK